MLEAVFRGHSAFIFTAITVSFLFGLAVFLISRNKTDRPRYLALWCASMSGVAFLTLWSDGGSQGPGTCVVNLKLLEPFSTEQGILNFLMFTPVGFFGALATRQVLAGFASGVALSAAIETAQGAMPAIGRACDTSDLLANSVGGLLGALVAFFLIRISRANLAPWRPRAFRTVVACGSFAAILGIVWASSIQPRVVAATEAVASADSAQRQAVDDAVHQAFGDHYAIGNIRFSSSPDGDSGTVMASLPVGFVQVNWPERNEITASLDMSDSGKPSGFPVPGAPAHVTSSEQATQVATKYAQKHFPWGVPQTRVKASAVGDNASLGWLVSWRRYHNDVLMPMRLDVQIDRSGHVSQLSTRQAPDVAVPPVRVNNKKTAELAMNAVPGCRKVDVGDLFAMRTESKWQAVWRVVVTCKDSTTLMNINATSGAIETKEKNSSRG